jgi:WD40 repeat protein
MQTLERPLTTAAQGAINNLSGHIIASKENLETGQSNKASFNRKWDRTLMRSASFSTDEQLLISSKTGLITVWQVNPFQRVADSDKGNQCIGNHVEVTLSEDQPIAVSLIVSTGSTSDRTSQLLVWQIQDAFPLRIINPPFIGSSQPMFTSFALSPDSHLIATGDDFGGFRFWNVQNGEELASYDFDSRPLDLDFTPEGSGLVIVLADSTIRLLGVS